MNPLANPTYLLPPLIASFMCLILLVIVIASKTQRRIAHRWFLVFLIAISLWAAFIFFMRSSPSPEYALPWDRAAAVVTLISTVFFYHFTIAYTNTKVKIGLTLATYAFIVVTIILGPTRLLIDHVRVESYGYAYISGPLLYPMAAFAYFLMGMGLYNLIKAYKTSAIYEERNRLLYVIIAASFPIIGTVIDFSPSFYPMAIIGSLLFSLLTTIAILRHHLLDVRVVIRKSLAYLLASLAVAMPYVGLIILFGHLFRGVVPAWVYVVLLLILAVSLQPLWGWTQRIVDRLFYRTRYDYLRGLEHFGQQIRDVTEFERLASSVVELTGRAMQVSSACLIMPSLQTNDYRVVSSRGLKDSAMQYRLQGNSPFIKWMERTSGFLQNREIDILPQLQHLNYSERKVLRELSGELYIPLKARGKLVGILILGHRLSEQPFTMEDLRLLSAVSTQIAASLENAKLYQQEKQRAAELFTLQQSSAQLATELDLDMLLQIVAEETARLLQTDAVAVLIVEEESQSVVLKAAIGVAIGYFERPRIPLVDLVPQQLMGNFRQGEAAVITNDVKAIPIGLRGLIEKEDIHSVLEIPVVKSGKLISVIAIFSKHAFRSFTEEETSMAQTFAHHVALAIDNAHFYGLERQQRQKLEELDVMRSNFLIAISHELRTPLTSIKSAAEVILDETKLDLRSPQGRLFSIINRSAERMGQRIQELLDFIRIQSDALRLEVKAEDIRPVIKDATSLCLPFIWKRKQTLKVKLPDLITMVMVDRQRFEQIMWNLVSNASKYSPQGSEIMVEAWIENSNVIMNVSDEGPGIPAELREQIFQPYVRGENNEAGLGIGLSIAKSLAEAHGGRIWFSDRQGGGSTFSFSLPTVHDETK